MRFTICIHIIFILTLFGCSRFKQDNIKREYYDNGNIKSEVLLNTNGEEEGMKLFYTEDGKIHSWLQQKNGMLDGYRFFFYPNGKIETIEQYQSDTANGDFIWFDENGNISTLIKYMHSRKVLDTRFDSHGNIYDSSPFMTIKPKTDTIKLGETYSANITLNYCLEGFTCEIFKRKEGNDPKNKFFDKIGDCPSATFTITPTKIGQYVYEISYMQKKYYPNRNDSVQYFKEGFYEGKFWVK